MNARNLHQRQTGNHDVTFEDCVLPFSDKTARHAVANKMLLSGSNARPPSMPTTQQPRWRQQQWKNHSVTQFTPVLNIKNQSRSQTCHQPRTEINTSLGILSNFTEERNQSTRLHCPTEFDHVLLVVSTIIASRARTYARTDTVAHTRTWKCWMK